MQTVLGGATVDLSVAWPVTISGWLLLLCYALVFGVLVFLEHQRLAQLTWKQWLLLLCLSGAALFFSLLRPPIPVPDFLSDQVPTAMGDGRTVTLALLSAVPYLLAGTILGSAPALLAGLMTGLGRTVGLTHQPYDLFGFAFAAWIAARLMGQWYQGRSYQILRLPLVSGSIGQTSSAVFAALAAFANSGGLFTAIDAALSTIQTQFWPLLVEGLVSGSIVTLLVIGMAQWLPRRRLSPSPAQRSIRRYLQTNVVIFGGVVFLFGAAFVFFMSTMLASRVLVTEMAASSNSTAAELDAFRSNLEDVLAQSSGDEDFARGDKASAARGLGRAYRNAQHFQEVMLVDQDQSVVYAFPALETAATLFENEQAAVVRAVKDGLKTQTVADLPQKGRMLSIIVPVTERKGQLPKALVARLPAAELVKIMAPKMVNDSTGMIIDRDDHVLMTTGPGNTTIAWANPLEKDVQSLFVPAYLGGEAFLKENERESRDVHYLTPPHGSAWRVAAMVPYENVLNQAFANALPVMLVLFAATAVFYARFASYGQNLAGPISELAQASRTIAAGGSLTTPVDVERQDEVGELGRAFTGMQRTLKGRLDELSLLLAVGQDVSTSIDINQSMPVILQGAVRGTGAAAARAVILNPRGRTPLVYAEGPAGEEMQTLDRTLMVSLRGEKELACKSPGQMSQLFDMDLDDLPVKALIAMPLQLNNKFQGIFYLGYHNAREFDKSERNLLHTLAGQAAVLVENAHLYARAESGRQRLQAVLASTTEAVIVTDQTERIFMLNKAMEEAFRLSPNRSSGRAVGDVINSEALVKALTQVKSVKETLEVLGKDGRTYYANISPIVNRRLRVMGRVAVLHDVTRFKEANSLKSEFVSNVAHDLKTPLTIISQSASELGMDQGLTKEQQGLTANIIAAVDRIVNFVDTMLDIERLEAGTKLVYEQFDVGDLFEELAVDHWYYARSSGLKIRTKLASNLPLIRADRAALYQAVENLLSNGIKYAPHSGELLLAAARLDDQVVISVRDKGPGIAERDQLQLFEKGYRVKRHGSGKVKGSGMGLSYVKTAAKRHGGRAWCVSELRKGSTFFIAVPVRGRSRQ